MDTSNIIKGVVNSGRYTVTAPIVKEDYGLYLQIEGVELPSTYEVDFSNSEHNGTSVTMIGNSNGVLIPHQFIDTGKDVFAFLYHVGADFGRTVYKFRIPNKVRPDRTEDTPTPEEQSVIDQAISALNEAVERTAQDVESADASAQSASADADRAEQARDDAILLAQRSAQSAQESADYSESASESATASAQSASQAQTSAQTASEKADSILNLTASAQTLPAGSSASASYDAQTGVMTFGIPKGDKGDRGEQGIQGIQGERGLTGAKGDKGDKGDTGAKGDKGDTGATGPQGIQGEAGPKGDKGDDYTLTEQDKQDIAELVDAGGMVVTATLISGVQYSIDSTYDDIKSALSQGKTVVVMTQGVPQPYVGNVQLNGEWFLAFGVSTIYDNVATLTGFMIPETYQNVAIWTEQNTTIPQLNDVQINGQSIVADGVANVPMADETNFGAVTVNGIYGIGRFSNSGALYINIPTSAYIKSGTHSYRPIVPKIQHESTFYGLAKASGDTTQSASSNAVGTYTDEAKASIQAMLDVPSNDNVVKDVQVNGTSVLNNGIGNIPIAHTARYGAMKAPTVDEAKAGAASGIAVSTYRQHTSVFYGLAKVAGHDEKDSTLPAGEYTEEAKIAIQKMLGIYEAPWELIREDTFNQETAGAYDITTDANGEAFNLTDIIMLFEANGISKFGQWGQIAFLDETKGKSAVLECGAWNITSEGTNRGTWCVIRQENGILFAGETLQTSGSEPGAFRIRHSVGTTGINGIEAVNDPYVFSKITIREITGAGHYKLYGRRKWQ